MKSKLPKYLNNKPLTADVIREYSRRLYWKKVSDKTKEVIYEIIQKINDKNSEYGGVVYYVHLDYRLDHDVSNQLRYLGFKVDEVFDTNNIFWYDDEHFKYTTIMW